MKKTFKRKLTSSLLTFLMLFQIIAGVFLPFDFSFEDPFMEKQEVSAAVTSWYSSNYAYRKTVTIKKDYVSITQSFPVLVSVTDTDLRDNANTNGLDIIFVDTNDTTLLNFEIESWDDTTGELQAWVEVDVSATVDKAIYMYYGYSTTTDISDASTMWSNAGAVGIWHMAEGEGSSIYDSSGNGNTGTIVGADWATDGLDFVAANTDYVELGDINEIESSSFSITTAFKIDSLGSDMNIITKTDSHSTNKPLLVWYDIATTDTYPTVGGGNANAISVMLTDNTNAMHWIVTSTNSVDTNPHILTVTFNNSTNRLSAYIDGILEATYVQASTGIRSTVDKLIIGTNEAHTTLLDGQIKFNYLHNRALSAEEVSTQYNNTNSPSTFAVFSAEEELGTLTLSEHTAGQETNAFTLDGGTTDLELASFKLTNANENINVNNLEFTLSGVSGLANGDWSNIEIMIDDNNDGNIVAGETTSVGGVGVVNIATNTITFSTQFTVSAGTNYILRADIDPLDLNDKVNIDLTTGSITATGVNSGVSITPTGSVPQARHSKSWYNDSWSYRKAIIIDYDKVDDDFTNFPVLVSTTDTDLITKAKADGYDIVFTDFHGTLLDFEIEKYITGTGELKAWVSADISSTTNTTIYMYYGNDSAIDISDAATMWNNAGGVGIWHIAEGEGDYAYDSSGNGNTFTNGATVTWEDGGLRYDGSNSSSRSAEELQTLIGLTDEYTAVIKYKIISRPVFTNLQINTSRRPFNIGRNGNVIWAQFEQGDTLCNLSSGVSVLNGGTASVAFSAVSGEQKIYVDGDFKASNNQVGLPSYGFSADVMNIGDTTDSIIYYVYIYNRILSAEEVSTQYNNTDSPETFLSFSAEVVNNVAPTATAPTATQETDGSGLVEIQTIIDDANDNNTVRFKIEYSLDGGSSWTSGDPYLTSYITTNPDQATEPDIDNTETYQVGMPTNNIITSAGANTVTIKWDTQSVLNGLGAITSEANVKLRVTPNDGIADGTPAISAVAFTVDNTAPTGTTLGFGTITATSIQANASGASDSSSGLHATPYYFDNTTAPTSSGYQAGTTWDSTPLSVNTQYTFRVKSKDAVGNESVYTATQDKYTLANVPFAPTVNNATTTSLDVTINQNSNPANTVYAIYETSTGKYLDSTDGSLDLNSEDWQSYATWGGASGITATPLSENTAYSFQVKARNGDNTETVFSSSTGGTTNLSIPASPSLATLSEITATTMKLTWTDNAFNETGFKIEKSTDGSSYSEIGTVLSNVEEYNGVGINSLNPNEKYWFRVRSYNGSGNSGYSIALEKYTLANAPTSLSLITDSTTQITASWNANSNSAGTEYYCENTTAGTNSGWITSLNWVSANLTCGTSYSFRVKARNGDNIETAFTDVVNIETEACSGGGLPPAAFNPPSAPTPTPENPIGEFSVLINSGDEWTNSKTVSLKLIAGADTNRMAISDNPEFENASIIPYKEILNHELNEGSIVPKGCGTQNAEFANAVPQLCGDYGTVVVYAKFYTQYGVASEVVSDSIILDTAPPTVEAINIEKKYNDNEEIIISGTTESNAKVVPRLNGEYLSVNIIKTDNSGNWNLNLGKLIPGDFKLELKAKDLAGNIGETVVYNFKVEEIDQPAEPAEPAELIKPDEPIATDKPTNPIEPSEPTEPDEPNIIDEITDKIIDIIKPDKPEPEPEIPTEELIAKETPSSLKGEWNLLPQEQINEFVLAPLPKGLERLAQKFPELQKTFEKVGINKITDLKKLRNTSLSLPGLTKSLGLGEKDLALVGNLPISELPEDIKNKIPSEIIFARIGETKNIKNIDFNIKLSINKKGEIQQKIRAISGKKLFLTVKPEGKAKRVTGYLAFKGKMNNELGIMNQEYEDTECPRRGHSVSDGLFNSFVFAKPAFAQDYNAEIEEKFITEKFAYADEDGDGIWTAEIYAPIVEGEYEVITLIEYEDPELGTRMMKLTTVVDPEGYVYERIKNPSNSAGWQELRIMDAVISIYKLNSENNEYELWEADKFQQENPQTTNTTGRYSFLVPEGTYYITAEASDYSSYQSEPFTVQEGAGVHQNIELKVKGGWLKSLDWKVIAILLLFVLVVWNFWKDRRR